MWMIFRVFKENSFASATVEIANDQRVISTGPFARNPMYASATLLHWNAFGAPFLLGLIPSFLTILGLVWRLFDEEEFLAQNLAGYTDYCAKVQWHMIPGIF
jgi:protein-S-isoprenylcysteine O-methyltransferase Ste14